LNKRGHIRRWEIKGDINMTERRFGPIPHNLTFDQRIGIHEKIAYQLIVALSFRHGYAYFSSEYASKLLGMNRNRFIEAIDRLDKTGWIMTIKRRGAVTRYIPLDENRHTLYEIKNEKIVEFLNSKGVPIGVHLST
jgi:predicted transcriptional regulator of viral defense system